MSQKTPVQIFNDNFGKRGPSLAMGLVWPEGLGAEDKI